MHLKRYLHKIAKTRLALAALVVGLTFAALANPAAAEVVRDDTPQIEGLNDRRIYEWKDTELKPKAVAIAVHGLVLHGGVYDKLARELAGQGYVVVAPDLRGYGRWCPETESLHSSRVSYDKSYADLKDLVRAVRNHYPALPLYVIGESLGAGMTLHLAADMPQSIDGIVLSSPAIKRRIYMEPRMVMDLTVMMLSPSKEIDLVPYIKRFASEDPQVVDAALSDPLVRRKLTMIDLLKTSQLIKSNIRHAAKIPDNMPVLIIQGDRDRMLRSNGVVTLLDHLKCKDQTVKWFPGKGHLLLETPHIMPETVSTVSQWLSQRVHDATPTKAQMLKSASIVGDLN